MKKGKHIVRDVVVWSIFILGFSKRYKKKLRKNGSLVRVLCFHDVPNAEPFGKLLQFLQENYNVITPEQFHCQVFSEDKINILLTFDDGYQSWTDVVMPVLEEYAVKGLFFVNSGLLDAAEEGRESTKVFVQNRLRLVQDYQIITWKGVEKLSAAGHTIGGHTVTHPNLAELEIADVRDEVFKDKKRLEGYLGVEILDFAYPFGTMSHYTSYTTNLVSEEGYEYIYTAEAAFWDGRANVIPRTLMEYDKTKETVKIWIEGGYDIFKLLYSMIHEIFFSFHKK